MQEMMLPLIYIRLLEDSQFIGALTVSQFVLSFLGTVTTALQSTDCNLADAYDDVALASVFVFVEMKVVGKKS